MLALIFFSLPLYASEVITGGAYLDSQGLAIYGESIYPTVKPGFTGGFVLASGIKGWCGNHDSGHVFHPQSCQVPDVTTTTCPTGTTANLVLTVYDEGHNPGCAGQDFELIGNLIAGSQGGYTVNVSQSGLNYWACDTMAVAFYWTIFCIPNSTP